jgi:hypothetical protein
MNSRQFQELQEAYMNVYQEIDEAKVDLEVSTEEVDVYDVILSHLLDEGYADTEQAATAIMVNMSEVWRDSVVEAYKELPVGKMIRKVGTKQFKHGMSVGSGASSNPKVPAQVGKMSAIASLHDPERAKAKSKMKKD